MWTKALPITATYGGQPSNVGTLIANYYDVKTITHHVYNNKVWVPMVAGPFVPDKKELSIEELAEIYPAVKEAKQQLDFIIAMVRDHDECKESNGQCSR